MAGVLLRSRARWVEYGEKPSRYFLNLEKRNFVSKSILELRVGDGVVSDTDAIMSEVYKFYTNLYHYRNCDGNYDVANLLHDYNIRTLHNDEANALEGDISDKEVLNCLKKMSNNKAPGLDGWPAEFFKLFWSDLSVFIVRAINNCYRDNELSLSISRGIVTLIPKQGKDRKDIKNWRPITLLSVIYKLISGCINNRLKTCLPALINSDQTGFLPGRYIGENIRLLYDLMFYTEKNNIPGLLLSIDFEKAFDSLNHNFIWQVLHAFGFGQSLIKWCKLLLSNNSSCVLVNGGMSKFCNIERGAGKAILFPLTFSLYVLKFWVLW